MLSIRKRTDFRSRIRVRQTLRTAKDLERERLGTHLVDEVALPILQVKQIAAEQCVHEKIAKTLGFHAKHERI